MGQTNKLALIIGIVKQCTVSAAVQRTNNVNVKVCAADCEPVCGSTVDRTQPRVALANGAQLPPSRYSV